MKIRGRRTGEVVGEGDDGDVEGRGFDADGFELMRRSAYG